MIRLKVVSDIANVESGTDQDKDNVADNIKSYLKLIGKYPLLSSTEKDEYGYKLTNLITVEVLTKVLKVSNADAKLVYEKLILDGILERNESGEAKIKEQHIEICYINLSTFKSIQNAKQLCEYINKRIREIKTSRSVMTHSNLRFVVSVAVKYQNRGIELLDLIQEGNIGLMTATKKFDYRKGVKFTTYARWWIRQRILKAIKDLGRAIRLPMQFHEKYNKIMQSRYYLIRMLNRNPSLLEISEHSNKDIETVQLAMLNFGKMISINDIVGDGSSNEDFMYDESQIDSELHIDKKVLENMFLKRINQFPAREATIIKHRFEIDGYEHKTLEELGKIFGVSRERIRQVENMVIKRLKKFAILNNLNEYLGLNKDDVS